MSAAANVRKAFQRLPGALKPLHYDLRLKPDLKAFTFKGWVKIELFALQETKQIVCNASELKITSLKINERVPKKFDLCEEKETLTIDMDTPLSEGTKHYLSICYTGILNDQMKGFYRSKYSCDGEERFCAVTQFEATDARRCFPCWDEPECKSTFSISVIAPKDRTVHSNMPKMEHSDPDLDALSSDQFDGDTRLVNFEKSLIMSTYLVAIVVGEFESIEGQTSGLEKNIRVRMFTPKGKTEQGQFALSTAIKALEYYSNYFEVPFPLPKYDSIAIADFACGAMENFGLVTYRESCVLVDPKNTSSSTKQWVAIVVTHETAHQWFGDLTTMKWWTHLWLNEGFASFMENQSTFELYPEFDIWPQFVADTLIAALELDALDNSHPIEVEVGHPSEVDEIFDNISYNKGASVIRMLHNFIGDESFRKGMKNYLDTYKYKNAETADLWNSLEGSSGQPVGKIMGTWTSQMGFPLLKVECAEQQGENTVLTVSQKKFNADGSVSSGFFWNVPINVVTSTSSEPQRFLLTDETSKFTVANPSQAYVKINNDFMGYYRTHYDEASLTKLRKAMADNCMSELNRLNILDDLIALVQSGNVSADVVLEFIKTCPHEKSYVVWRCINSFFSKVRNIITDEEFSPEFSEFILNGMSEIVDHVGWKPKPDEHHTFGLLRMMVLSRMGSLGHAPTVKEAKARFAKHVKQEELIPADLRAPVYRVVAANGGKEEFKQMLNLYKTSELSEEKDRIARAMGSFPDVDILSQVLTFSIGDEVRSQDTPFFVGAVGSNPKGKDLAWEFFKTNFDLFLARYKTGALMARLIKFSTDSFLTEEKANEVQKFFEDHSNPAERTIKQSLEVIRLNSAWLRRDRENIRNFLKTLTK